MSKLDFGNYNLGVSTLFVVKFRDFAILAIFRVFWSFLTIFALWRMGPPEHLFGHMGGLNPRRKARIEFSPHSYPYWIGFQPNIRVLGLFLKKSGGGKKNVTNLSFYPRFCRSTFCGGRYI